MNIAIILILYFSLNILILIIPYYIAYISRKNYIPFNWTVKKHFKMNTIDKNETENNVREIIREK